MAMEMLARPIPLATNAAIMISPPLPPYSSGMARPVKPCSPSLCHNPAGKASSRSISAIRGRISFCPNTSALSYANWCSSESSKSIDTRLSCREMSVLGLVEGIEHHRSIHGDGEDAVLLMNQQVLEIGLYHESLLCSGKSFQAVLIDAACCNPSSSMACLRMINFCILPVTVMVKASTN